MFVYFHPYVHHHSRSKAAKVSPLPAMIPDPSLCCRSSVTQRLGFCGLVQDRLLHPRVTTLIRYSCTISNDSLRGATGRYTGGIVSLFYSQDHREATLPVMHGTIHISLHLNLVLKIRFMFL